MKAADFEYRHQTLAHQVVGDAAFLAYLLDRDHVVWRLVKDSATRHRLERFIFIITTLLIATCGENLRRGPAPTAAKRQQGWRTPCLAFPSAVSRRTMLCPRLGFSRSSWGFVLLVVGEALRVFALIRRDAQNSQHLPFSDRRSLERPAAEEPNRSWRKAFRHEAVKMGILVTLIVFMITRKDRYAEFLAVASLVVGTFFNLPVVRG